MLEISLALRYLLPSRRYLSRSLISLLSMGVIALVVALLLVFLSVLEGIERNWLTKLTALTAPVRVTPTQAYYDSYYYQIDSFSQESDYQAKTLSEKLLAGGRDPYNAQEDPQLPISFPAPDYDLEGKLLDPVGGLHAAVEQLSTQFAGLIAEEYELGGAMLQLQIVRSVHGQPKVHYLSQATYLLNLQEHNPGLASLGLSLVEKGNKDNASPIWLPTSSAEQGVQVGDRGTIAYPSLGPTATQEQHLPVEVAGFYDPGIASLGAKCILVPPEVVRSVNSSTQLSYTDPLLANGFHLWPSRLQDTADLCTALESELSSRHLESYWTVTPYYRYEATQQLLHQFAADRILFSFVGLLILTVACCNVISSLILLVYDKKREIAILRALGLSRIRIACIFGMAGIAMGVISSLIGALLAAAILAHFDLLIHFLSFLQGSPAWKALLGSGPLPSTLSSPALTAVAFVTPLLAMVAGLIPAWMACRLQPTTILRGAS